MSFYSRSPDTIATDMDGETVMMSMERGQYFGLGGVGSRVWALLEQPAALDTLVEQICAEFAVPEDVCRADLQTFLGTLVEHRLVIEQG